MSKTQDNKSGAISNDMPSVFRVDFQILQTFKQVIITQIQTKHYRSLFPRRNC